MTTPADLAANAARVARRTARRAGILEGGTAAAPEPTLPEHVYRLQMENAVAAAEAAREAHQDAEAEDATVREEDAEATDTAASEDAPADKPKRTRRSSSSKKAEAS